MSEVAANGLSTDVSGQVAPDNRYASAPAWRAVDDYFAGALVPEDTALVAARDSGSETTMPNAEVAANQGAFLGLLTQIAGARRVLEFGTLAGYSTIWFARAVGADGHVVTFELEETNAAVARENLERAGVADRVDVVVGPAAASAQQLIDAGVEPFDLVFIDADKPSNPAYLAVALELTRAGAVIVIDNVVRDGAVVVPDTDDPRVQGVRHVVDDIVANQPQPRRNCDSDSRRQGLGRSHPRPTQITVDVGTGVGKRASAPRPDSPGRLAISRRERRDTT